MNNIYGKTLLQLENYFLEMQEKKFKARQIFDWLYRKRVTEFKDMSNMKLSIREHLEKDFSTDTLKMIAKQEGNDVVKYLFELEDGQKIEAVLMVHNYGNSLCVSTQVGCNMGCTFCESGRLKKIRNLETHEMVLQLLHVERDMNMRISHVVMMGIGEPFDNYDNVMDFIDIINESIGLGIGSRHITISTCGIIPKIKDFTFYGKQVNLAISLHAPNDEIRSKIMPINKAYPLTKLIPVIKEYINKTNRRVTFEYILIRDINDSKKDALDLASLVRGMNVYINLIPYNETSHIEYKQSTPEAVTLFFQTLKKEKINATIRREFGSAVSAACGQLRSNYEEEK